MLKSIFFYFLFKSHTNSKKGFLQAQTQKITNRFKEQLQVYKLDD